MNGVIFAYLAGSTAVFMAANAALKTYATGGKLAVLAGALALFCLGNFLMAQVMRGSGLGVAIALSLIFQLIAITLMAVLWFGEKLTLTQGAGMVLGIVAVALIVWPKGASL